MKKLALAVLLAVVGTVHAADQDTVYQFKMRNIDGKMVPLSKYKGKVLMIVNVASKCGHTPQYAGLEKLYEKYKKEGFVILGFPCNQFREQEPGTDKEIKAFCTSKYNVTFPLFDKIEVNGDKAVPLYQFLKKAEPEEGGSTEIGWNFTKFLIDRKGHPLKRFVTKVEPEETESAIQEALKK
ncbi:MAG TPA: glutathione peroxidase [bacterium]|nr:glutathione peroxidase [bacterium]